MMQVNLVTPTRSSTTLPSKGEGKRDSVLREKTEGVLIML